PPKAVPFQVRPVTSWNGRTEVPRIVDWYMDGKINIDDLVTHVMPHEKINEGFEMMRRGETIRTVLTY
ncbi:MAG: hypothetical protein ACKOUS_05935, partial [Alphaproteobacteria bacterium]